MDERLLGRIIDIGRRLVEGKKVEPGEKVPQHVYPIPDRSGEKDFGLKHQDNIYPISDENEKATKG